jgi:hypothetical protein
MRPEIPTANFPWLARAIALRAKAAVGEVDTWAERNRAPERVQRILKSGAIPAGTTLDADWAGDAMGDYRASIAAFFESLRTTSAFFRLLADNALRRVPLRQRVGIISGGATGWVFDEGKPARLSQMTLRNGVLEHVRAAALVVMTDELWRNVSTAGQLAFARELKGAVSDAVDGAFLDLIVDVSSDGSEVIESSGTDGDNALTDLRRALLAVGSSSNAALYWIAAPDVAKRASALGPNLFPAMSALGGELLNLPCLVSSAADAGSLYLIDASRIAADAATVELRASSHASIEMESSPDHDAASGQEAALVSMFQTGATALMATVLFGAEPTAADCVAIVQNIEWESM